MLKDSVLYSIYRRQDSDADQNPRLSLQERRDKDGAPRIPVLLIFLLPEQSILRKLLFIAVLIPILGGLGWWYFREQSLPDYGPAYREYAYVSNGKSNTVSVIDLRTFALAKTIHVGSEPTGIAANKKKNEIYVVNSGIEQCQRDRCGDQHRGGDHRRAWHGPTSSTSPRTASAPMWPTRPPANVSVIDLEKRLVIGNVRVGASPGLARVSPDGSTVVVSNRGDNTVSLIDAKFLRVRATLPVCQQPEDIAILPDSSKAFVACSGSSQVASIALQSTTQKSDRLMALLDVGRTPVSLTLKPDGGELMVCNFDSDSISIIETGNDEVGNSLEIGQHPARGVVTRDNSRLYVTNFGSNSVAVYDIDMGRRILPLTVGSRPDGLALTPDEKYLLVLDTQSGDVTVIQKRTARRTLETSEYSLLTLIPVGVQPNAIVVKAFMASKPLK